VHLVTDTTDTIMLWRYKITKCIANADDLFIDAVLLFSCGTPIVDYGFSSRDGHFISGGISHRYVH